MPAAISVFRFFFKVLKFLSVCVHLDIDFSFCIFFFVLQYITFLCVVQFILQRFFIVFDDFFLVCDARSFGHFSVIVIQLTVDFFSFVALYNIVALLFFYTHDDYFPLVCGIKLIFMCVFMKTYLLLLRITVIYLKK